MVDRMIIEIAPVSFPENDIYEFRITVKSHGEKDIRYSQLIMPSQIDSRLDQMFISARTAVKKELKRQRDKGYVDPDTGERLPDVKLEAYFVEYGVQVDVSGEGTDEFSICRDFRDSYSVVDLTRDLVGVLYAAARKFVKER